MSDGGQPVGGTGHFVPWDGACLLIGRSVGVIPEHSHYALQVTFGSQSGVRFRTGDGEPWTSYDGAIIASQQPHSMDASDVPVSAVLLVEPETREGRALAERALKGAGIAPLPESVLHARRDAVFAAWHAQRDARAVADACQELIRALAGGLQPTTVTDERILRAIAYINANIGGALSLEDVAAEAFLSPSRFRHLFVAQTGVALRPYILWRRFLRAWALVTEGASLSAAAHASGFADAAHLSRTSRRMFGFPPSALHVLGPLRPPAPKSAVSFK